MKDTCFFSFIKKIFEYLENKRKFETINNECLCMYVYLLDPRVYEMWPVEFRQNPQLLEDGFNRAFEVLCPNPYPFSDTQPLGKMTNLQKVNILFFECEPHSLVQSNQELQTPSFIHSLIFNFLLCRLHRDSEGNGIQLT
jgi:hypothetical protein